MHFLRKTRRWLCLAVAALAVCSSPQGHASSSVCVRGIHIREANVRVDLVGAISPATPPITHYSLPPEKERQAVELARTGRRIFFAEFITEVVVLLLLLRSGWAARFRDLAERVNWRPAVQAAVFWPLLLLTLSAANLPFRIWGHVLARSYGLSVQGWPSWMLDWIKSEAVSIAVVGFVGWIASMVIRRSPRRWWLGAWAVSVPLMIMGVYAEPFVVEPLFYDFHPLIETHPALAKNVQQTATLAGITIPQNEILEMDASRKVNWINAYVAGIGNSKRVVFWDTLLARTDESGALFTFGHELGHYALNHAWKYIGICALGMAVGYPLLVWVFAMVLRRFGDGWRIRAPHDWVALAALFLLVIVSQVAMMPLQNAITRHFEHKADVFGLEIIQGAIPDAPQAAARMLQVLGEANLEEPAPSSWNVFWLYTHPPIADRVRFALHYDPWSAGLPPKFDLSPAAAPSAPRK
jgi:STE24 endopeptidase